MITAMAILLATGCGQTVVENRTSEWDRRDYTTLVTSSARCRDNYPQSPCVKLFRKHGYQAYHVLCREASED